jgi:hypothetical protein
MQHKLGARQCEALRVDGLRCRGHALEDSPYCNYHTMTPEERHAMASRGGKGRMRKMREREAVSEDTRPLIEFDMQRKVDALLREMLSAKLPGIGETDFRRASAGLLLVWILFDLSESFEQFAAQNLPRDVSHRAHEAERAARDQLNEDMRALGFRPLEEFASERDRPARELLHLMNERV